MTSTMFLLVVVPVVALLLLIERRRLLRSLRQDDVLDCRTTGVEGDRTHLSNVWRDDDPLPRPFWGPGSDDAPDGQHLAVTGTG